MWTGHRVAQSFDHSDLARRPPEIGRDGEPLAIGRTYMLAERDLARELCEAPTATLQIVEFNRLPIGSHVEVDEHPT